VSKENRLQVRIAPADHRLLTAVCDIRRITVSDFIRDAIHRAAEEEALVAAPAAQDNQLSFL
jgi:uncharacterized protein (DUF1778 family)